MPTIRIMEQEQSTATQGRCRVCGHNNFKFVGYQWLPISTIVRLGGTPVFVDPARPDKGAVELYSCLWCGNSYVKVKSSD